MPRRRQSASPFEEFVATFAEMPLKAGLVAAAVFGAVGLILPLLFPMTTDAMPVAGVLASAGRWFAWLFSAGILVASVAGAVGRGNDRRRFDDRSGPENLTWSEFERYLAEYFRRRGSSVTRRGGSVADGGVDLVLEGQQGRRIVQAKHWKARQVGVKPLRELWGVLGDERADGAIFVTSGTFTPDAVAFAKGKQLELLDGGELKRVVAEVKGQTQSSPTTPPTSDPQPCPQCGRGTLVRRVARRGTNAGGSFLGCSRFPDCRYVANL